MAKQVTRHTLGIMITSRAVHAALLESGSDGPKVIRRFMRQRTSRFSSAQTALPGLQQDEDATDFSVQFTENTSSMENMFLGSEFSGLDFTRQDDHGDQKNLAATFMLELGDILAECRDEGFPDPVLAFVAAFLGQPQEVLFERVHASSRRTRLSIMPITNGGCNNS